MRILFLENHRQFATTVTEEFLSSHEVTVVPSVQHGLALLATKTFDAFLVDFDLDDAKGDAFVRAAVSARVTAPIIAVSSHDQGNAALVEAGATTICSKLHFSSIAKTIVDAWGDRPGKRFEAHLRIPRSGWIPITFVQHFEHVDLVASFTPRDSILDLTVAALWAADGLPPPMSHSTPNPRFTS